MVIMIDYSAHVLGPNIINQDCAKFYVVQVTSANVWRYTDNIKFNTRT